MEAVYGRHSGSSAYRTERPIAFEYSILFASMGGIHPEAMGAEEVDAWLSYLANERSVAISTQKTALNAVVYLYRKLLGRDLGDLRLDALDRV